MFAPLFDSTDGFEKQYLAIARSRQSSEVWREGDLPSLLKPVHSLSLATIECVDERGVIIVFPLDAFGNERRFRAAWESVKIAREVKYSLFTFGETDLPYYLILSGAKDDQAVSVTYGDVKITRPMIIRPDNSPPEFEDFFENSDDENLAQFIMARSASFSNLKLRNHEGAKQLVSDSVEETVAKLTRRLDDEEEDRVAILLAPANLAGFAVLRYASERIMQSIPDNIQELREKGFLP